MLPIEYMVYSFFGFLVVVSFTLIVNILVPTSLASPYKMKNEATHT